MRRLRPTKSFELRRSKSEGASEVERLRSGLERAQVELQEAREQCEMVRAAYQAERAQRLRLQHCNRQLAKQLQLQNQAGMHADGLL